MFNLQVEGEPEYFANGVLVHNCAMSKFVLKTRRTEYLELGPSTNPVDLILASPHTHPVPNLGAGMNLDLLSPEDVSRLLTPAPQNPSEPTTFA